MDDIERLKVKFSKCSFTLSKDNIYSFSKDDNGPINNVITGLTNQCFGVHLLDEIDLTINLFYINGEDNLKGDLINLNLKDKDYFDLLFLFCSLLSDDYPKVNPVDAFNTFQTNVRSILEKLEFFTITNLELKKFEGKSISMMSTSPRGIFKLELIDKGEFYRSFFNDIYKFKATKNQEHVYLMLNLDTSLIKIGTSKNPEYRERTLHSQEPSIYLIGKWPCNKSVERELHSKFSHKRIRGEWFRLNLKDLREIEEFMELKVQ